MTSFADALTAIAGQSAEDELREIAQRNADRLETAETQIREDRRTIQGLQADLTAARALVAELVDDLKTQGVAPSADLIARAEAMIDP